MGGKLPPARIANASTDGLTHNNLTEIIQLMKWDEVWYQLSDNKMLFLQNWWFTCVT